MKGLVAQQQRKQLINRLHEKKTPALNRLAQAIKAGKSHQDVVNYSRMHNRHNRT